MCLSEERDRPNSLPLLSQSACYVGDHRGLPGSCFPAAGRTPGGGNRHFYLCTVSKTRTWGVSSIELASDEEVMKSPYIPLPRVFQEV